MSEQTTNAPSAEGAESTAAANRESVSESAAESNVDDHDAGSAAAETQDQSEPSLPSGDASDSAPEAADELIDAVVVEEVVEEAGAEERARMMAQISTLEADLVKLEAEKQDNWNRYLRATADTENVRRRAKRDVEDARIDASTKVLKEMLPVIDNLERALDHAERKADKDGDGKADDGGILEGIKLVMRQFSQALERCGVTPVPAVGQPFDPNVHEAISQVETADMPPGSVFQALQSGYKIGERLLRPALVVVSKAPSAPPPADDAPSPDAQDAASGPDAQDAAAAADGQDAAPEADASADSPSAEPSAE